VTYVTVSHDSEKVKRIGGIGGSGAGWRVASNGASDGRPSPPRQLAIDLWPLDAPRPLARADQRRIACPRATRKRKKARKDTPATYFLPLPPPPLTRDNGDNARSAR